MRTRDYIFLFALGVMLLIGIATQEAVPGYMDADYYYATGLRIANTGSWTEPFLWNYLNEPEDIPNPAFTYWMPLAGVISALGIVLTGLNNFWGAKLGFILLASLVSPLTAYLAYSFISNRWAGFLAGSLALISGFYYVYLPTTETFSIYMILGAIFFIFILRLQKDVGNITKGKIPGQTEIAIFKDNSIASPLWLYLLFGTNVGLMYLTRADGIVWLGMAIAAVLLQGLAREVKWNSTVEFRKLIYHFGVPTILVLTGFILIVSPLILRNLSIFGSIFAPGSGRAIWLTTYDELYVYPAAILTFGRWLNSGIGEILKARGWALGLNSLSAFAVQGTIFLGPFIVVGMWVKRKDWRVSVGAIGWLVVFLMMTLIFPFQGARGGFFHAGAGFQPLFWALVPVGLLTAINWVAGFRNWEVGRAIKLFAVGIIGLSIVLTIFVSWRRLSDADPSVPYWGKSELAYREIEEHFVNLDVSKEDVVMVNNPPGYFAMNGRGAIAIPDGDLDTLLLAADKYNASYLILDENYPQGLSEIYKFPRDFPELNYIGMVKDMQLFLINQ